MVKVKSNYIIPLSRPSLQKNDYEEIKKCFDSTWISSKSPWVNKFEKLFARKVSQTKYAVAVNSGTSALFLALKALKIGPGDEVIVPTFTMIATVNAVVWTGATPVLVDSQSKHDWNISISEIEKKITKKTKAIIPVHIYGYPCQMDKIMIITKKYRLFVIEDAAEAMGSAFKKRPTGSFGDAGCFSLYSNKIITTGNGGVVVSNNEKLCRLIKQLSFFDFNPLSHFTHNLVGYNLVLSGLQAALGLSQLKRFDRLSKKRKIIYQYYKEYLHDIKRIKFREATADQASNYWFPAVLFSDEEIKENVRSLLEKEGIETRGFFLPIHHQPAYRGVFKKQQKFPKAEFFYRRGLLLPSYYVLKKDQVKRICGIIRKCC